MEYFYEVEVNEKVTVKFNKVPSRSELIEKVGQKLAEKDNNTFYKICASYLGHSVARQQVKKG